jgi:hypothetical protein
VKRVGGNYDPQAFTCVVDDESVRERAAIPLAQARGLAGPRQSLTGLQPERSALARDDRETLLYPLPLG